MIKKLRVIDINDEIAASVATQSFFSYEHVPDLFTLNKLLLTKAGRLNTHLIVSDIYNMSTDWDNLDWAHNRPLYGLTMALPFLSGSGPIALQPYSQYWNSALRDGHCMVALSVILSRMGNDPLSLRETSAKVAEMAQTRPTDAQTAIDACLKRFRANLLTQVDFIGIRELREQLQLMADDCPWDKPASSQCFPFRDHIGEPMSVCWCEGDDVITQTAVHVHSLFADILEFSYPRDRRSLANIDTELAKFENHSDSNPDLFEEARAFVEEDGAYETLYDFIAERMSPRDSDGAGGGVRRSNRLPRTERSLTLVRMCYLLAWVRGWHSVCMSTVGGQPDHRALKNAVFNILGTDAAKSKAMAPSVPYKRWLLGGEGDQLPHPSDEFYLQTRPFVESGETVLDRYLLLDARSPAQLTRYERLLCARFAERLKWDSKHWPLWMKASRLP